MHHSFMKRGRLGLTVVISLFAVVILILIQIYVIHQYYQLKSKDFDASYSRIITKSLDESDNQSAENPFDSVYSHFDRIAYRYMSLAMFDSSHIRRPEFQKQITDSFRKVLEGLDPNTRRIRTLLALNNMDTTFSSKYSISEISLLNFNRKINIYQQRENSEMADKKSNPAIYIKSYHIEGNYFLVKFDYYVDFTRKAKTIYTEMKGLLTAVISTILVVLLASVYTLQMLNKHKKLSELKSDFIDQITHEFKTPLSSIAVAVSSLKLPLVQASSSKINELADNIRKQYQFLTRMIDHVLETSLIERKKMQINKKSIAVKSFMLEVVDSFRAENDDKKIQINEFYEISDDYTYHLDPLHFSRVVTNLLGNSVKYSNPPAMITIKVEKTSMLRFVFSDHGIGIEKEQLKNVFNKFYRVENQWTHKIKGLGLGLYIARQIVESHGGVIEIKSELNMGTSITIKLPLTN